MGLNTNLRANLAADVAAILSGGDAPETLQSIGGASNILDLNADVVTLTSGKVSAWPDQSGRGNTVLQGAALKRPAQLLADYDGHAALSFTGSDQTHLGLGSGFTGIAAGDKPRWYLVGSFANFGGNRWMFEITDFGTGTYNRCFLFLHTSGAVRSRHMLGGGATMSDSTAGANSTAVKLYDGQVLGDASVLSVNGVANAAGAVAAGGLVRAPTGMTVGIGPDLAGTGPLDGKIHRIAVFNPAPDAAMHARIMAYFARTYPSLGL